MAWNSNGIWCQFRPNCRQFVTRNDMEFPWESTSHFLQRFLRFDAHDKTEWFKFYYYFFSALIYSQCPFHAIWAGSLVNIKFLLILHAHGKTSTFFNDNSCHLSYNDGEKNLVCLILTWLLLIDWNEAISRRIFYLLVFFKVFCTWTR